MLVVHKAAACVVRAKGGEPELLVCDHPHAGLEIAKGTVDPGEDPASAALRELAEETGITYARLVEPLAPMGFLVEDMRQIWHCWIAVTDHDLPDSWDHVVTGAGDENGMVFQYRWLPTADAQGAFDYPPFAALAKAVAHSSWVSNRLWGAKALEWEARTGSEGDHNRQINSDPVLWQLLGDVRGQRVLDAGCGTGYLAAKLTQAGAAVVAVDNVPEMVALAKTRAAQADVRLDNVERLDSCADGEMDAVVSNYVIQDLADLDGTLSALRRVLRPDGRAVLVFSHPCFTSGDRLDDETMRWTEGYFARGPRTQRWGPFATRFLIWHRTLSDYLRAFNAAGFSLDAFEEPIVAADAAIEPTLLRRYRMWPYAVAVRLTVRPTQHAT